MSGNEFKTWHIVQAAKIFALKSSCYVTPLGSLHTEALCKATLGVSLNKEHFPSGTLDAVILFCEGVLSCTTASQAGPVGFKTRKQSLRLYIYYVEVARETETTSYVNVGPASWSRRVAG